MKKHLEVFMGRSGMAKEVIPPPTPTEVLYADPNVDGSRKMCQNCLLWLASDQQCLVHSIDLAAYPEAVCGYHVFGAPSAAAAAGRTFGNLRPEQTGYVELTGGSSCDRCLYFTKTGPAQGTCSGVRDPDTGLDAVVATLGCCTRWTGVE